MHKSELIFLCENFCDARRVEEVSVYIDFKGAIMVDRVGRRGGLAMLWKKPFESSLINYTLNFINMEV